ncbi:ATP-binding protein [Streptomyces sp. NPDC059215]|uniref:ATP-binding protein n=1 Tax=Streptomyces sp. NPDC059215 TaxID=3346772 RepID=UPI0036BFF5B7
MDELPEAAAAARLGSVPLEASLALNGDAFRIAHARRLAATFLTKARDHRGIPVATATVEIVQLIVSELVTNARKHAPGPARLNLRIVDALLRIELWDSNPVPAAAKAPDPTRNGQHGMEIVAALAQTLIVEQTQQGKRITADVALTLVG